MNNCLICNKHKEKNIPFIHEGEHAFLYHYHTSEEMPEVFKGHLFVEPKRHVESFADLTDEEAQEIGLLVTKGCQAIDKVLSPEHFYTFTIMHQVPHLHVHIIPRYPGTPEEFRGGQKIYDWPDAEMLDSDGVNRLTQKLGQTF